MKQDYHREIDELHAELKRDRIQWPEIQRARDGWDSWQKRIVQSLGNEKEIERLVSGVQIESVPNFWLDPEMGHQFESAFMEELFYQISKPKITHRLAREFNRDYYLNQTDSVEQVRQQIVKRLKAINLGQSTLRGIRRTR